MEYKYCKIGPNVFRIPYDKEDNTLDYFHIEVVYWDSKISFHFERNDLCYWVLDHIELDNLEMYDNIDDLLTPEDYPDYCYKKDFLNFVRKIVEKTFL